MSNVVDLKKLFGLDKRVSGFFKNLKATALITDMMATILAVHGEADQRFLAQMIAWRLEGAPYLPADEGLVNMPLLHGMGLDSLVACAQRLEEGGVIRAVVLAEDKKTGEPIRTGFYWPELDAAIEHAMKVADGPQITGLDGLPLK